VFSFVRFIIILTQLKLEQDPSLNKRDQCQQQNREIKDKMTCCYIISPALALYT